ncbi:MULTISPECIES: CBS domain-containing protein [Acetomicrobium]|jgi:CBS domain-containing protein|uniref:CBS domain-containing protein n=1 Tax=Acetomicrobium TaxID=49894 RepID=UPI001697845E|nr:MULTISPECIES: CBS domain-containing protein [Acetomicrobium]MDI9377918.1 CBS domain-containing protein [Synergistota bacterium]NLI43460.1 CBS domain-containing protein [Synergistaceae bacterium]MBP8674688.1 CBS domain-containing protein [Acetomicrobium sp.]MDR9770770.1 CBS domain-containing protein [Acetomicrobium sp.]HOB11048.1 CBS domain-containing protein [Acetomicrobium sp.]
MDIVAQDLMQKDLTVLLKDDLVIDAVKMFYIHKVTGVPVIEGDWHLVGFISESDILKATLPTYLEAITSSAFLSKEGELIFFDKIHDIGLKRVEEFMTKEVIYVDPTTSLISVVDLMMRKRVKRLPVVENGRFVGMIDRCAFCEFLMERGVLSE